VLEVQSEYETCYNYTEFHTWREPSLFLSSNIIRPIESGKPSVVLGYYKHIKALEDLYTFDNRKEVYAFFSTISTECIDAVIDVLTSAPNYIAKFFADASLHLKVVNDPEDDFELLFIQIRSSMSADDAIDMLDVLDDYWWLKVDGDLRRVLAIDV
jgi:hypothetical protein